MIELVIGSFNLAMIETILHPLFRIKLSRSPKRFLRSAKTRSQEAELGEMANTMRAASAQAGNDLELSRHQARMAFE